MDTVGIMGILFFLLTGAAIIRIIVKATRGERIDVPPVDGMFDTFYKEWFRTVYLGVAQANGLETAVTSFGIEDDASQDSDNIEHALITVIATDKDGAAKSFDMDWQIIFDKDDTDLIQKVELTDDGGLYEAYQDGQ